MFLFVEGFLSKASTKLLDLFLFFLFKISSILLSFDVAYSLYFSKNLCSLSYSLADLVDDLGSNLAVGLASRSISESYLFKALE